MPALVKEEAVLRSSGTFPFFNFNQRLARKMIDNSIRQVLVVVGQQISSATGVDAPRHHAGFCIIRCIPTAVKDVNGARNYAGSHIGRHNYFGLVVVDPDEVAIYYSPVSASNRLC